MPLDDWDIVMNVHINGTAYVTHAAWQVMYEKNYGRIVCTSSGSGIWGNFGQAQQSATCDYISFKDNTSSPGSFSPQQMNRG